MKKTLLVCLIALFSIQQSKATHLMGGEITVQQIANNTYVAAMLLYRDTTGINAPFIASLMLELNGAVVQTLVAPTVSSISGTILPQYPYGVEVHLYVDTFVISTPGSYTLSHTLCCRNGAIQNLSNPFSESMTLITNFEVFPSAPNSTPFFLVPAAVFLPVNTPWQYNPLPFDMDGDSLHWSIDAPLGANGYVAGFVMPSSDPSNPFSIDPATGTISWTANMIGNFVASILVEEYRNGVLIGSIRRDMQYIVVGTGNSPLIANNPNWNVNANGIPSFQAYYGTPIQIQFIGQHPDSAVALDMADYGELRMTNHPSYNFAYSLTGNGSEIVGVLDWLPALSDFRPEPYKVVLRISDNLFTQDALIEISVGTNIGLSEDVFSKLSMYPNPSNGIVNIEIARKTGTSAKLNVYSTNGALIESIELQALGAGQNYIVLQTTQYKRGMYYIEVITDDKPYREKLMVE